MAFLEKLCSVTLTQLFLNLVGTIKIAYRFKDQLSAYLSIYLFIYSLMYVCSQYLEQAWATVMVRYWNCYLTKSFDYF